MVITKALCEQFGRILGVKGRLENGFCSAEGQRKFFATIEGKRTKAALDKVFSFESLDRQGRALNLGEVVVLASEQNRFISALRKQGIKVTAAHNHWLFDKPVLYYIHFQAVEKPLTFARKTAIALKVLGK